MKSIKESIIFSFLYIINISINTYRRIFVRKPVRVGFVVEEYFHENLRGFGGYGISAKRQVNFLNQSGKFQAEVLLSSEVDNGPSEIRNYHNSNVVLRPGKKSKGSYLINFLKYAFKINFRGYDVLLCTDWYKSYEYVCKAMPHTPIIVWIRDPRSKKVWEQIMSVPMERLVNGDDYTGDDAIQRIVDNKLQSFQRMLKFSESFKRKITFVTTAQDLVKRAQDAYGVDEINAKFLPNTIEIPDLDTPQYSEKPSICFVGRLDPVKRPWIVFELAKRFPEVDFHIGGSTLYPELMEDIFSKYKDISNLKILGLVTGDQKDELFRKTWALLNCSSSEGMPVTFLEAFSYGKPVISCRDTDDMVKKFGYYTGEVEGEGMSDSDLEKFERTIKMFLDDKQGRIEKGIAARKFVKENYTLETFRDKLAENLKTSVN